MSEETRQLIETAPSSTTRAAGAALVCFALLCVMWAALANIDIIVVAQGVIVPADGTKVIQADEAGTIRSILVSDGQRVGKDQLLVALDSTPFLAERDRIARELSLVRLDIARLNAMLADDPLKAFAPPSDARADEIQLQLNRLRSEVDQHRYRMAQLQADLRSSEIALERAFEAQRKARENVRFLQDRASAQQQLTREHLLALQTGIDAQHAADDAKRDLRIQDLSLQELTSERDSRRQLLQQEAERYKAEALHALADDRQNENRLEQDGSKAEFNYRHTSITSPVDGVVQELAVHTVGGAVTEAQPLMTIVPAGTALRVDAWVGNGDSGYVHADQRVRIKVDAYDFTQFGTWEGTVGTISSDAVSDRRRDVLDETARFSLNRVALNSGADSSTYYMARVQLDPTPPRRLHGVELKPGMTVQAEIVVGERRAIEYFLSPVIAALDRPFASR